MRSDADLPAECTEWLANVDCVMQRDWCIGSRDAGWSREDVLRYWKYGETAECFVAWFAEKYGLIRYDLPSKLQLAPAGATVRSPG